MLQILFENIYVQLSILGLILTSIYFQQSRKTKLNEPPLVPYRFPIIGHTLRYLNDCENLILESRQKYGEIFSLYVFGQLMTVAGKESTNEILKKDKDFDFREASKKQFPTDKIFVHLHKNHNKFIATLKEFLRGKIKDLTSRLQQDLIKGIDIFIGECDKPKVIHDLNEMLSNIVSIPIANIVVGEECYYHEDILETFRNLTHSVAKIMFVPPILSFIHPWLHQQYVILPLRFGRNPFSIHRDIILNRVRPVIEKRLKNKKELGDAWVAPLDVLQAYLNDPEVTPDLDPNNVDYDYIADVIGSIIFAAMTTTSQNAAFALYNLAGRKEYWQELYEEAQEIDKLRNGNDLTNDDIVKMVKLDSFVKESLRLSNDIINLPHICNSKPHYTFENGYQIPNGRIAMLNLVDTTNDEDLQGRNPKEFYAYRHLERNTQAAKIERNFLAFGGGKHACPGRYLAVNEIKMILHKILLKYNIRTESGKALPNMYDGTRIIHLKDGVIFEKKK